MNYKELGTLSKGNLKKVIELAAANSISHKELADWCSMRMQDVYKNDEIEFNLLACQVAEEIDAQWELFLSNTLPLQTLQTMKREEIQMPKEWLEQWINRLQ